MNMRQPLVSINITTYNSSKFIIETLESAKMQTYQNIELIVSDDSSVDNTVELCKKWIEKNKERFVRCKVITVEKNTGIAANSLSFVVTAPPSLIACSTESNANIYHSWMEMITGRRRQDYRSKLIFWISILIIQCVQVILSIL